MDEYELEWVSEGMSMERAQEQVSRLNKAAEQEKNAYQLLESARKIYDSIQNNMTLEIYDNALDWYMYWADMVDDIITEIESEGGVIV
jgi:hypothetical protein